MHNATIGALKSNHCLMANYTLYMHPRERRTVLRHLVSNAGLCETQQAYVGELVTTLCEPDSSLHSSNVSTQGHLDFSIEASHPLSPNIYRRFGCA